ncbi:MAG: amidase family protein [Alphaproteobacteria bacterium]
MTADILALDATDQLAMLAAGKISAVELLDLATAREAALRKSLNLVVVHDIENARASAKALDDRRVRGEVLGPLAGLPMTLKDTLDVVGMPASAGVQSLRERAFCEDAETVARARAAGAVFWGKTNVPVMAGDWQSFNSLYGTSNNPWDQGRTIGGSSGGAAGCLATGITALEIGSDIGGSLRVPANFCGVYSHKPTWEAVSQRGHVPPAPGARAPRDLNVVGPMARSARDLQLLFSILSRQQVSALDTPKLGRLRVGLWLDEPLYPLDPEARCVIEAYARQLEDAGVEVDLISSPVNAGRLRETYQTLLGAALAQDLSAPQLENLMAMRPAALAAKASGTPMAGQVLSYTATHLEWLEADEARAGLGDQVASTFERYDVLLAPVTPVAAFPHDHGPFNSRVLSLTGGETIPYASMLDWISLATVCRLPSTCVPAGLTATGLPVGIQIIGPAGGDARTLAVAAALAEIRSFMPPPLA